MRQNKKSNKSPKNNQEFIERKSSMQKQSSISNISKDKILK